MGEVYRARDAKLKRDVALKVLPETFASDPRRMGRFQREAEVLASLNHPNIAHIYGVEERALVMEMVEGESPKGPMAFDEAWHIASQIAAALEYAHDKGRASRSETRQFEGRAGGRGQAAGFRLGEGIRWARRGAG
jgi:serine/threonine-protein kinase